MRQSSYSYRVHTQKKQYLENLIIMGDVIQVTSLSALWVATV